MFRNWHRRAAAGVAAIGALATAVTVVMATVTPGSGALTVPSGTSATTTFTVDIPAGPATSPLTDAEIEIAIDTTGSMASGIAQARADAAALVAGVQAQIPSARFSVVQFRDRFDVPEYQVEQPLTTDATLVTAALGRLFAGGGGDAPEAHNLVFTNASAPATGGAIGWTAGAPKFVIVLSDAQPHGAGSAGYGGCTDISADPFGLNTRTALGDLAAASRTLFMVLEPGALSASLPCYQSLALSVSPESRGFVGGTSLASQLVPIICGTTSSVGSINFLVNSASPAPAAASWISTSPATFGPLPLPASVSPRVNVAVPAGTPAGPYTFDIVALADGLDVGHYLLTVTVVDPGAAPGATATPVVDKQKRTGGGGGGGGATTGPDLQVGGASNHGAPAPGETYVYTFQVKNSGGGTATNVTFNDSLPTSLTFVSMTNTAGTCGHAGGQVSCDLGSMAVGGQATIAITVQAPAVAGAISNTASVLLAETDPKPANNTVTVNVTVK